MAAAVAIDPARAPPALFKAPDEVGEIGDRALSDLRAGPPCAELAKQDPHMGLFSLAHHIDLRWLYEAYRRVRIDAATGVDGKTAADYSAHLGDNLRSLLERAKSGTYRAPPVRRVHIPKGTGDETRPIGIPTFEDKILQRAVVMVLEAVYEQDFRDCSYGFRPGRSAHQALATLWKQTMKTGG